jgi:DNA double-strand break repair helicase HerA and related ATPase
MDRKEAFSEYINAGYACKGDTVILGGAMLDGSPLANTLVKVPLKTMNRHGLIAGATGTGKTKTLQVISEQLSEKGVPVLLMDVKGDLSGIAMPGEEKPFITERQAKIGLPYSVKGCPVELLTISKQEGVRLRATVSEFGPVLLSRILDLNDTQSGVLAVIFKFCDDKEFWLLDLKDLKTALQYITEDGKTEFEKDYGKVSTSTTGIILRKVMELEEQDADLFFGEPPFNVKDLMSVKNGCGYVNIIRLTDIQDKPKLFSTFMLCLLTEVYNEMPEKGDVEKPDLVIFIDEAHLIFDQASKALLYEIELIVKLIRSKGIGVFFVTQNPMDVPSEILAQLGLKVQHALRAFTANDRKSIKLTAENFPISEYYKTDEVLTSLGIGEALVTALDEKGIPAPLVATMMRAPMSRMDILSLEEIEAINKNSELVGKYRTSEDKNSAYEKIALIKKDVSDSTDEGKSERETNYKEEKQTRTTSTLGQEITKTVAKNLIRTVTSVTFMRGVLGMLLKKRL